MKPMLLLAGALFALTSTGGASAHAGHHHPAKGATTYQCAKCHMKFTAAKAKADHYKDPMDGGKLIPIQTGPAKMKPKMKAGSMPGMKM